MVSNQDSYQRKLDYIVICVFELVCVFELCFFLLRASLALVLTIMSILQLPTLQPFDPHGEPTSVGQRWKQWKNSLSYYVTASGIRDNERKRAILLHLVGQQCQEIFETFTDTGNTFDEALQKFDAHFSVQKNTPFERHKFHQAKQESGESIDQFITRLRKLSIYCEYGGETGNEIRDMVIAKTNSTKLRKRLLIESNLTLQKTQDISRLLESAEHQSKLISEKAEGQSTTDTHESINKIDGHRNPRKFQNRQNHVQPQYRRDKPQYRRDNKYTPQQHAPHNNQGQQAKFNQCGRCGMKNHTSAECRRSRDKICQKCGIKGHFATMCRTKPKHEKVHATHHHHEDIDEEDVYLFKFNITKRSNTYPVLIADNKINMIIDSGSTINIIDHWTFERLPHKPKIQPSSTKIYPYNAKRQLTINGTFKAKIKANDQEIYEKIYVIPGHGGCIMGQPTAEKLDLLRVGPAKSNNLRSATNSILQLGTNKTGYNIPASIHNIIRNHQEVFKGMGKLKNYKQRLHIDPSIVPVQQATRRIPYHTRQKVSAEIKRLLDLDIIEPVSGPTTWVSPIVVVPKKNNRIRLCIDMRRANTAIIREKHPIPKLEEILPHLTDAKVFSKIDLREGYHQIELDEESRSITAFITHEGIFRYKRLIYGISSAFEHFQKRIEIVIADCEGAKNISDDIFIWGKTQEEHDQRLDKVLTKLAENGLRLNVDKCEFSKDKITFSGYTLTTEGISLDSTKVEAVNHFKQPTSATEVRSFLGLVNYCSKFIKNYSTISAPLRMLTKKDTLFVWNKPEQTAFDLLKEKLTSAETMAFYRPRAETKIIVDASPYGLGAILTQQQEDGSYKTVAYGSRALTDVEQRYSQTEREALAVHFGCIHFHFFIYDRSVTIVTDHKSLLHIMSPKSTSPPLRIQRWLLRLQGYEYTLEYQPGAKNAADILSRSPLPTTSTETEQVTEAFVNHITENAIPMSCTIRQIQDHTTNDVTLQKVVKAISSSRWPKDPDIKPYFNARHDLSLYKNIILKGQRIVIPQDLQRHILDIAHQSHQGVIKTKHLLREKVWWPQIGKHVEDLILTCHACQVTAPAVTKFEPSQPTDIPSTPWETIAMDIQGPYPTGDNLLVMIDYRSRYPIVVKQKSTSTQCVINAMKHTFSIFGYPKNIVTDNGPQFTSLDFRKYLQKHAIAHRRTTPYWPQANGEVERFNRTLKRYNQTAAVTGKDWRETLNSFLLDYRTTPHTVTKVSPATLMFGRQISNDLPDIRASIKDETENAVNENDTSSKLKAKEYTDAYRKASPITWKLGERVLIKNLIKGDKLSPPWLDRIFTIVKVYHRSVLVEDDHHRQYIRANGHVKLYRAARGKLLEKKPISQTKNTLNEVDDDYVLPPYDETTVQRETSNIPLRLTLFIPGVC